MLESPDRLEIPAPDSGWARRPLGCVSSGTCSMPVSPDFCHLHCGEHLSYPAGFLQGRNQPLLRKLSGPRLALVGVKKMAPVSSIPKTDTASLTVCVILIALCLLT